MKQLFINIVGHNASGKTTLAQKLEQDLGLNLIRGDDFRYFIRDHIRYFHDLDISGPNPKSISLRPLLSNYRYELIRLLLSANQSVILDGSGFTRDVRRLIKSTLSDFPKTTHVIIQTQVEEDELLMRLKQRGDNWQKMYDDIRKNSFEPPATDEADVVLSYSQRNYDLILKKINELLA